jgi:5'-nucleotidase / UDP-sugar diphosphatase
LAFSAAAFGMSARSSTELTVLFTNDFHGHVGSWLGWEGALSGKRIGGLERVASVARQVRQEVGSQNVLLLDAGDAIADTLIARETKGKALIRLMNEIGYAAMTIGNHEPDYGPDELCQRIDEASFPVLAANLTTEISAWLPHPYLICELGGVAAGILGLAYPNTPLTTASRNVRGLQFQDLFSAAAETIPQMKADGAQLIILLTHNGLGADLQLARQVEGIDLIVGGHSHNRTAAPLRAGRTLIVQAGAHGSDVGRLDLWIEAGRIERHKCELILLDNNKVPADVEIAGLIRELEAPWQEALHEQIATAAHPIIRAQTIAGSEPRQRDQESPADSLFADILREETGCDASFLPGVGYGVAIPAGPITADGLRNLLPHDSKVVTCRLTGEQILEILEQSLENTLTDDPRSKVGGMVQISGLSFSYDPHGRTSRRVRDTLIGGGKLDLAKSYTIATNSMLAQGGHRYRAFLEAENHQQHTGQYEMVRQWMSRSGHVQTPAPGRIVKLA